MNARTLMLAGALLGLAGCGDVDRDGTAPHPTDPTLITESGPLSLAPRVDVRGVEDVFDVLEVTRLRFDAELFVLPEESNADNTGAVVTLAVDVADGEAVTELVDGDLTLAADGRYRVLLRIAPLDDGISVNVDGAFAAPEPVRGKGEPAPTPAEPAPTPAEPAPTPAEPAPTPAEPAPTPAEPGWGHSGDDFEPCDTPGLPSAEPAPTPAEPAPTPARTKEGLPGVDPGDTRDSGAPVSVSSREAYEFYVGVVEILPGDTELVITWDVRPWLRSLLADPLGITVEETDDIPGAPGAFQGLGAQFLLIAQ